MQARGWILAHRVVGRHQNLEEAVQIFFAKVLRGSRDGRPLIGRRSNQIRIGAAHARDEQVAHMADRFAAEVLKVVTFGDQRVHQGQHAFARAFAHRGHQLIENFFAHHAKQLAHLRVCNVTSAVDDGLFEQRLRIAQAAFRGARQDVRDVLLLRGDAGARRFRVAPARSAIPH